MRDVGFALGKLAKRLSTRSVRLARMILIQAVPGGIRTGEARALRWPELDVEACAVAVRRSVRRAGETKTGMSRGARRIPETPRELRHTFVSLWPDIGRIADPVGRSSSWTTEVVYRHQLRPVTRTAAIALGPLFGSRAKTNGGQS
jgi:integrase